VKQDMATNINIRLKPTQQQNSPTNNHSQPYSGPPSYPSITPDVNFPIPNTNDYPPPQEQTALNNQKIMDPSRYQSAVHNPPHLVNRETDFTENTNTITLENRIKVLEGLLELYESAPVLLKGCLVVNQKKLIDIIQILTGSQKVELLTDDVDFGCCQSAKLGFVAISKIFCVNDGHRVEFKVGFNEEYSLLLRHSVNLKLVRIE
jgi:hypothetical protein